MLSAAAFATSWSGYQSTLWNGTQARLGLAASAMQACATRAAAAAGEARTIDLVTFVSWLAATAGNDARLARFYERRMRPEFAPAFSAWLATRPVVSQNAPAVPFVMPEYRLAADEEAARCDREAKRAAAESQHANNASDNYMLATVVFAVVLFFAGGVQDARSHDVRLVMMLVAVLAFAAGFAHVIRLPRGAS